MQDSLNSIPDDEINLRDLFITLWAYKLLIIFSCIISIICSIYYIQNTNKKFTSTAIFKLDEGSSIGFSFSKKDMNPLAGFAGIGKNGKNSDLPLDQVAGRVFIQKLDAELNFQSDPYFNTYNPKSVDPIWKSPIKRAIGWQKTSVDA